MSFRASDRCHWRGNPFPAPAGAEIPASLCEGGVMAFDHDGGRLGSAAASSLPCVKAAQCSHWVVRRSVGEVSALRADGGIVCTGFLPCHSEPVTDVTGVGIRPPRPQARKPLPPSVREVSRPLAVTEGIVCTGFLPCHSEPVTDVTGVGIRPPRPQAWKPLPPSAREVSRPSAMTEGEICRGIKPPLCKGGPVLTLGCAAKRR